MLVQCAKQITFCHVQAAVEEFHPFFTKEMSFVPAFDCSEPTGPTTTVGGSCRTTLPYKLLVFFSDLEVKHQYIIQYTALCDVPFMIYIYIYIKTATCFDTSLMHVINATSRSSYVG